MTYSGCVYEVDVLFNNLILGVEMPTFFVKNGIYIYIRLKNMKIKK